MGCQAAPPPVNALPGSDDPIVQQALQQVETTLRQEQNNQFALSKLMGAPALLNRDLLVDKAKSTVPNVVARIRHLWDEHPSWFYVPERFAHVG